MSVVNVFFYIFATTLVLSSLLVITSRNPVYSVIFLIMAFFNAAGLFILLHAEFLAMILVIVYVGAVAVLFLFVVMMLDIDFAELRSGYMKYMPLGVLFGLGLFAELALLFKAWTLPTNLAKNIASPIPKDEAITNTEAIGRVLYTDYANFFQTAGLILLVAMIGAIILTLHHKKGVKRQNIAEQVGRKREEAIEMVKVESGKGL